MNCYAKDMRSGFVLCTDEEPYKVLSVKRDDGKAKAAQLNPQVHDVTIVFLHSLTGEIETFQCNSHAMFVGVIAE